jgi:hypothetical protein
MDAATARATLVSYLGGPSARPALEDAELDAILSRFRLTDADGRRPDDQGWLGAYALNAAAAEGWRIKASRVAADFNFSADGASFSKGDVMAKCLEMEQHYAALDNGSLYLDDPPTYKAVNLWL